MTTKLEVYQDALLALGQERLAALTEANTARYALDDAYDKAVSYCLEQGFWNHAMRTVQIDSSATVEPAFGYAFAFLKPPDFVRLFGMSVEETMSQPLLRFVDEAGYWYADSDPLYAKFVSDDTAYGRDLSLWPETFAEYVSLRLAVRTCKRITGSSPDDSLMKAEKKALSDARSKDAMNEPPGFPPRGTWVQSRYWGSSSTRWDRRP